MSRAEELYQILKSDIVTLLRMAPGLHIRGVGPSNEPILLTVLNATISNQINWSKIGVHSSTREDVRDLANIILKKIGILEDEGVFGTEDSYNILCEEVQQVRILGIECLLMIIFPNAMRHL